jgi:hypothetical protein
MAAETVLKGGSGPHIPEIVKVQTALLAVTDGFYCR